MAHAKGDKADPATGNASQSWHSALGMALQETTLNPGWADVSVASSPISELPPAQDLPMSSNDLLFAADEKRDGPYPNGKPTAPVSVKAVKAPKAPSPLLPTHRQRAEAKPHSSTSPATASSTTLQSATAPVALPIVNTTLNLVPGKGRLASALVEFARANGWEIAWEIERDFPVDYPATFHGPFLDIITSVVASLHTTDAPIRAKIYHANKVVRIIHATR